MQAFILISRYDCQVSTLIEACFFPLDGVVFFPSTTLPLNIFEPRYLAMTQEIFKQGLPLVLSDIDPTEPGAWEPTQPLIAGMGQVHLFEQRSDGTQVILVRGVSRVRLVTITQEKPFIRCQVDPLTDADDVQHGNLFFLNRLRSGLHDWAQQTLPDAESRGAFEEGLQDPKRLVEMFAHYKLADVDVRQQLLETTELNARVELLRRVL